MGENKKETGEIVFDPPPLHKAATHGTADLEAGDPQVGLPEARVLRWSLPGAAQPHHDVVGAHLLQRHLHPGKGDDPRAGREHRVSCPPHHNTVHRFKVKKLAPGKTGQPGGRNPPPLRMGVGGRPLHTWGRGESRTALADPHRVRPRAPHPVAVAGPRPHFVGASWPPLSRRGSPLRNGRHSPHQCVTPVVFSFLRNDLSSQKKTTKKRQNFFLKK